ncbi:LytTR family DNA-binding domain-containing protein [Brevundimonas vesicularis]|uniref:LytTR family DNA-binding domain-containing protein n=1 Tax=Brevundimonas vesicularis TaxID=41276 RepID=UPI0038D48EA7
MSVTGGGSDGTNGADFRDLIKGGGLVLILALVVVAVNTTTTWVDTPDAPRWMPVSWEFSSWIGLVCALWVPWLTAARAPADQILSARWGPRLAFVAVHGAGVVAFAVVHVVVFVLVRVAVYGAMGETYRFGDNFLFEFRKDLITYLVLLSVFWGVATVRRNAEPEVRPVSFDIRDGARIIRVPVGDILAVSAAGNYVEFRLADGRRPLMRTTLAAVEKQLAPVGFVRSHRSWLLNPERMTGLEPSGSGDWTVALGVVEVPVSRRYPAALERLRA